MHAIATAYFPFHIEMGEDTYRVARITSSQFHTYIHYMYIPAYIHGLVPVALFSHLHSLPFPSRRWQPIARTIWRAHHHHDSLLAQSEEYPITLYACMHVLWMYLCLFVYMYVSVFERMHVLPCADDVQLGLSEGLGQPTNDCSPWAGEDATLPSSESTPPSPIK